MVQADDDLIIRRAYGEGRVLITNDKDFGDKIFRDKYPRAGVLLLRLADERPATKVRVVRLIVELYGARPPDPSPSRPSVTSAFDNVATV